MAKRFIDCSLEVYPAISWIEFPRMLIYGAANPPVKIEPISTVGEHGASNCYLSMSTDCFTHMESKTHFYEKGRKLSEIPLEWFINDGVVIDMMHKKAGEGVTAADLEQSNAHVKPGDTIIIRTGWTDTCYGTREFWEKMIYLEEDAGDWILSQKPRALMQDFMTDLPPVDTCQCCNSLIKTKRKFCPNHYKFLGADMILIEWVTNLGAIAKPRVQVIALPIKLRGTANAPARVVVVEED